MAGHRGGRARHRGRRPGVRAGSLHHRPPAGDPGPYTQGAWCRSGGGSGGLSRQAGAGRGRGGAGAWRRARPDGTGDATGPFRYAEPVPRWESGLAHLSSGEKAATRTAFGKALVALGGARGDVVALDGEVADSTRTEYFAAKYPERFFECYIAEQQMISAATAMQARGWVPYAATFAAFMTRAFDFIRMAAVSRANLRLCGSHVGVAIGQDGPSQMGLEDLAMLRAVHGSTVLCPCDANQTAQLTVAMADRKGISYMRTNRGDTPVIYAPGERFPIGGSRVLRESTADKVAIVAAGVTVHQALAAADRLATEGIQARVIDAYSVKPIDADTLRAAARDTGRIVTVEDHWPEGGLGDAVLDVWADGTEPPPRVHKLAVRSMPASAKPDEQLRAAGIDADAIVAAARAMIGG
ncbi:transketolase [Phytohabitans flavus]|uniref:transketolase n=1 Tax=Phytohabitans flavus TaxID=1076124 RepID=UPI00363CE95A